MAIGVRSILLRYAFAILTFAVIIGIAFLLQYFSIRLNLTILVVVGLVAAAWFGGRGPGIMVAVLVMGVTIATNTPPPDASIARIVFGHFSVFALLVFIVLLISGRKATEKRLREQGELLKITLSSIGDGVIATDSEGKVTFLNPTAERITARSAEEAIGKPLNTIFNVIDEDTQKPIEDVFNTIKEEREVVSLSGNIALIDRDGQGVYINDSAAPILDPTGSFIGAVIVFQDVTKRREAELALIESEARLQQSQKLEAIGTLTGGVAHDFNNLLTSILGYTQLALNKLAPHDPIREKLIFVEQAGNRAAELTQKLLTVSRRQQLDRRVMNLNDSVAEILKLLERVIGADVQVAFSPANDLFPVYADPGQIEQVIMNLSLNARDAMPNGGRLIIETNNIELDEYYCRQYPDCKPGKYVQIVVSDTGTGIDTETLQHIFEPFFTTKGVTEGTGLGLSMVYGIVKQHDGIINVYSEIGHGTTFKVFLPTVEGKIEGNGHVEQPSLSGGSETILVAEDEESLRALSHDVLEALGYNVLLARDGEEAIKIFSANRDSVDLLLFDVVMPAMGGHEAARSIRNMGGNDVPLIFMTGYSSEMLQIKYAKENSSDNLARARIIQKPYTLDTLGRVVREALDSDRLK